MCATAPLGPQPDPGTPVGWGGVGSAAYPELAGSAHIGPCPYFVPHRCSWVPMFLSLREELDTLGRGCLLDPLCPH